MISGWPPSWRDGLAEIRLSGMNAFLHSAHFIDSVYSARLWIQWLTKTAPTVKQDTCSLRNLAITHVILQTVGAMNEKDREGVEAL